MQTILPLGVWYKHVEKHRERNTRNKVWKYDYPRRLRR